jgi:hypothetical protein
MKNQFCIIFACLSVAASIEGDAQDYTNFVRQIQVNSGAEWEVSVAQSGEQLSPLAINPGGARFELWTVESATLDDYLLDQKYVGAYVPQASLTILSEDPYVTRVRTRADRPFDVVLKINGMLADPTSPAAARMVNLQHFAQTYGASGVGIGIDTNLATLLTEGTVDTNGVHTYAYTSHSVPATNISKARGEERFTVLSLPDYQAPVAQIDSETIQIWPVADGSISGLVDGDSLRFLAPDLTVTLNDLYPDSRTYAQVYQGQPALGTEGIIVPGSAIVISDAIPHDRVLILDDWDSVIEESGTWTMELLTETPFGVDRLTYVTFTINRDIEVNGTVTTVE